MRSTKSKIIGALLSLVMLTTAAFTQNPLRPPTNVNFGGLYNATAFNGYSTVSSVPGATIFGSGTASFTVAQSSFTGQGNLVFFPFQVGVRILVDVGSLAETVTITAVSGCNGSLNPTSCTITGSFANAHQGSGIRVSSGSFGLDEAYSDCFTIFGSCRVLVDQSYAGTTATITAMPAALLNGKVAIEDLRLGSPIYYPAKPNGVALIAAPAAPVVTVVPTGTLSSGAYRVMAAYMDCGGGVSLASTDSTQTATTVGLSIASPVATTGACGWLPYITAAGGGTGTEILAKQTLDSTICPLSTLTVYPSCAIGSAATVLVANPSATSKPVVESTAFTTYALVASSNPPQQFLDSFPFGIFVATATLNNSNADAAQTLIPAGVFNRFGGSWDICVKGATATEVASSVLTVNLTMSNNYAQSPVTVSAIVYPTQTQAGPGTFEGCSTFHTSVLGSSGKFWAASFASWHNFLNSAPGTQVVSADASAANSSAIDLTKAIWFAVNLAGTGSANLTVPIVNSLSIRPTPGT